ncbi:MAG: ATP-binding protein [Terriglobales bacterium]|jgi:signal transduction histidine kinase
MSDQATRVLLIEDNPGDADLVRLRLVEGNSAVEVNCVERLADGIASLGLHPPSVVLLDLNLPDSHGAETFRTVLAHSPDVPVVILSGQDDEALALKAVHQGVQDYLVKSDITSKQLERAMRYAVERQGLLRSLEITRKQQLEFKNQFLSHVSHELRTPLTCIHQYVTILLDGLAGPLAPEQSDHLKTVLKSVNQLHAMIRDLLEATRAESGKLRVEPRCISIGELVQQAVTMMRPIAGERQIGLEIGLDNRIPLVYADPDRILEVLINLIDNAIKFTPLEGSVIVRACIVEADEDAVYVSVSDTGRGISPDAKALIFERLYQDPNSVDNNRSGLGLGLFICKELVRLHGGKIWLASDPGQGSTFTFTLPVYSLAKLLSPAIVHEQRLRDNIVLVKVELTPPSKTARGNWREVWQQALETLRRCVYLDKDLVLPPIGGSAAAQTFFVIASTDLQHAGIMMARIRGQLERNQELKACATLVISAVPVDFALPPADTSLDEQVQAVANRVTEMIMCSMTGQPASPGNGQAASNSIRQVQSIPKESS